MAKRSAIAALLTMVSIMAGAQTRIVLTIGSRSAVAALADNEAARALVEHLNDGPVEVVMEDYGGFEKVGALPWPLPASNRPTTATPGDIMLYEGRNIVVFYGSNSWSYTPLGRIEGMGAESVRELLGKGRATLTLSPGGSSGIDSPECDKGKAEEAAVYDLFGRRISTRPLPPGIYVVDGKKTAVR